MKQMKYILLSAAAAIGAFCLVTYSSCTKDTGRATACLNYSTYDKTLGKCKCKDGTKGVNCEIVYRTMFAGTYTGNPHNNGYHTDSLNELIFVADGDTTDFSKMHVTWTDTGIIAARFDIQFTTYTATSATFTVVPSDSTYTGEGSISATSATVSLREIKYGDTLYLNFYDFTRKQ